MPFNVDPEQVPEHLCAADGRDEPFDDGEGNRGLIPAFVADTADGETFAINLCFKRPV